MCRVVEEGKERVPKKTPAKGRKKSNTVSPRKRKRDEDLDSEPQEDVSKLLESDDEDCLPLKFKMAKPLDDVLPVLLDEPAHLPPFSPRASSTTLSIASGSTRTLSRSASRHDLDPLATPCKKPRLVPPSSP